MLTTFSESDASSQAQPTPRHSNVFSSPPSVMPPSTIASPPSESAPRTSSGGLSIGSLVHPHQSHAGHPQNQYNTPDASLNFGLSYMPPYSSTVDPYFYGSEGSHSPNSEHLGRYHRQSISSASSVVAFDPSAISPTMTTSMPGTWMPATAPPLVLPSNSFEEGSTSYMPVSLQFCPLPTRAFTEADQSPAVNSMPLHLHELDGHEFAAIQRELSTVPGLVFDSSQHGLSRYIRWDCLNHYWKYFHPSFPIVHKPTFLPSEPPPLLLTATLAIGSFYDTRPDAKAYSLALQEIATRLLRRRTNITARSRIADLQTVLLLEILSKFCARQVSAQTSARFRALFASLHQSRQWLATSPLAVFKTLKEGRTADDLKRAHKFWMEHETRRRIFHACSVLDAQQVALFEQRPTIVSHSHLQNSNGDLKSAVDLPCSEELWEASPIEEWSTKAASSVGEDVHTARANYQRSSVDDYSFFQHQIINLNALANQRCAEEMSSPSRSGTTLSRTRFNYHAFQMVRFVPVRSLLIVAGESWFLGRKIEHENDYMQSKREVREWLAKVSDASTNPVADAFMAHWHALKILRMLVDLTDNVQPFRSTNMLHEDWVVYLAALICWALGYGWGNNAPAPITAPAPADTTQPSSPNMSRKRKNREVEPVPRKRQASMQGPVVSTASPLSMLTPSVAAAAHTTQVPYSGSIAVSSSPVWSAYGPTLNNYTGQWENSPYYENVLNSYTSQMSSSVGAPVTTAESAISATASTAAARTATNTPQSQSSLATTTAPTLTSMPTEINDDPVTDFKTYLMLTDVTSAPQLANLDVSVLSRTQGVLEVVRIHKIGSKRVIGGLMNEAERVLARLIEGRCTDMF